MCDQNLFSLRNLKINLIVIERATRFVDIIKERLEVDPYRLAQLILNLSVCRFALSKLQPWWLSSNRETISLIFLLPQVSSVLSFVKPLILSWTHKVRRALRTLAKLSENESLYLKVLGLQHFEISSSLHCLLVYSLRRSPLSCVSIPLTAVFMNWI